LNGKEESGTALDKKTSLDKLERDVPGLKRDYSFNFNGPAVYRTPSGEGQDPLSEVPTNTISPMQHTMTWGGETQPDLERQETTGAERRGTFATIQTAARNTFDLVRKSSIFDVYEKAKVRGAKWRREKWTQVLFEYAFYAVLIAFIYFVLIGVPLWNGAVWWLWWVVANKFVIAGGFSITVGLAAL